MKIAYGPPAVAGVKHLQYLSADEPDYTASTLHQYAKPVEIISLAVWAFGYVTKNKQLQKYAGGISLAAVVVDFFTRPK